MTVVKNITRISYKKDPEKGERGALPRVSSWAPGKTYYSGNVGEVYVDYAYYDGVYYRCKITHNSDGTNTPYALVQMNSGIWEIETGFEMVATKVAFIGSEGSGWILDNGIIYHSSGKIALNANGSLSTSNGKFIVDADGHVYASDVEVQGVLGATSGVFRNVSLYGSVRSPFKEIINSWAEQEVDNIYSNGLGGHLVTTLGWDLSQSGRKITIAGSVSIEAPANKFFYVNGKQTSTLTSDHEIIELLGFGNSTSFLGWVELNRINFRTTYGYGRPFSPLAIGTIIGSDTGATLNNCHTFDGSVLTVSRIGTGKYKLVIPNAWFRIGTVWAPSTAIIDSCLVQATGYGTIAGGTNPIKACVASKIQELDGNGYGDNNIISSYISFITSDDASANDGSIMFSIFNSNAWD